MNSPDVIAVLRRFEPALRERGVEYIDDDGTDALAQYAVFGRIRYA